MLDRIILYEDLNEGLKSTFKLLGIPFEGELKTNEKSHYRKDRRPYQEVYTEDQAQKIAQLFDNEIKMHGYKFD